jgi:glutamate-1-semialdehyde aminotransferase
VETPQVQVMHFNPVLLQTHRTENDPALLDEIKRLRESNERLEKQVEKLSKDRSNDAQVDHEQRSVMINQNQESLTNQNQARRDAWRDQRKGAA